MAMNETTVKLKADISNLKAGMQAASRSVRLATTEFNRATAGLDDWAKSEKGLTEKLKQLNTTLDAQKKQAALARDEWEKTKKVYGENSAEADRAKMKLNGYETAVAKTEKELKYYEDELKDCQNETGRFAKSTDEADAAMERASDGFTVAKATLANLVAEGIRVAISALKDMAKATLEAGMNFESEMSKVKAISGATEEDMTALTEKAKTMGESTVFSASEAASAFEYMAMAGWKTEDMLNGIEGIMNLAAASGEDLATTSDIVTDALTAFGMKASDAGKLADIMAAASSNANTNVSMLGESFKYVAPLAGSMGYSAEDVATALGLMANSGVKASSAGTALRTLLTNMAKPTDSMASAMDELGISLDDGHGNMKSLMEIMKDLRKGFGNLKISQEDFNREFDFYNQMLEEGTYTQKRYDKAIEDLVEKAFGAEGALKAETAAMLAGKQGLSGLMAIVNATDDDFNKLTGAIEGSTGAAQEMAETMTDNVGGDITLLKSKVEGIMIKVFEKASGSIREAIEIISQALDEIDWDAVADAIGKIAKKASQFLKWCIDNADVIIEVIKSVVKVAATLWAVKKVVAFTSALNTAIIAVKGFAAALKAGATASEAMAGAGGMLATLVSPAGAIVLGLTAIAAVTASIISLTKDEEREIRVLTDEQEKNIEAARESADAYREMESARQESMKSVEAEYGHYEELLDELDSLVDANGKVKDGQKERAEFIVTTLNDALGTEIKMTGDVIENYKNEREEITKLLQVKKAQAMLSANEAAYTEAIEKQQDALVAYVNEQKTVEELRKQEAEMAGKVAAANEEIKRAYEESTRKGVEAQQAHQELFQTYDKLREELGGAVGALGEAEKAYSGYNATIKNYEGLSSSIISGDADKIQESLDRIQSGLKDHTTASAKLLEIQASETRAKYEEIKKAYDAGDKLITEEQVKQAERLAKEAEKEYKLAGENAGDGYVTGVDHYVDIAKKSAGNLGTSSVGALNDSLDENSPSRKTRESGQYFGEGYVLGMDDKKSAIYKKAYELGETAVKALKKAQEERSPSKVTRRSGINFVKGYMAGIASMEKKLVASVKALTKKVLKAGLSATAGDYERSAEDAVKILTENMSKKIDFTVKKMQYQNEQKIKEYESTIARLTKKMNATEDKKLKKQYQKQIDAQNKAKQSYQTASQNFISEFQTAMNEYSKQAESLVSTTINGISSRYQAEYDALIGKQEDLISKLRSAGELFTISDAGVLTINDINQQTKEIEDYTKRLATIKGKVSAEMFEEIAALDMREGDAFMKQILAMSDDELKAYSKAYDKKIAATKKSAETIYGKDVKAVEKNYKKELKQAFKNLPAELEALGKQAMKGFVTGLTTDTSYMNKQIKTFVSSMLAAFKKNLKIASPSKVMEQIGVYTGEGFVNGIKDTIKSARGAALNLAESVATPLQSVNLPTTSASGMTGNRTTVTNNYNLVQNNTSPKSLSALETYRARRQQIAMIKALT